MNLANLEQVIALSVQLNTLRAIVAEVQKAVDIATANANTTCCDLNMNGEVNGDPMNSSLRLNGSVILAVVQGLLAEHQAKVDAIQAQLLALS